MTIKLYNQIYNILHMGLNIFKRKPKSDAAKNQKILDNIMEWIEVEKNKCVKIIEEKGSMAQQATVRINFIREIYKKMNS